MVEINQLVGDDSNRGSGGSTRSLDEIPSANASKEAELEQVMISLYKEIIWPMMPADQVEVGNKHGSEGSTSSIDEFARVFASKEIYHSSHCSHRPEMELMVRIYKETICPMIRADIDAKQLKFLSVIRDRFGLDLVTGRTWNIGNMATYLASQSLQLQFLNGISKSVSTGEFIKGKDDRPILVALVDEISGKIVTVGPASASGIEIVVLEGDCNDDEAKNWTSDVFKNKIVSEWKGKKVLQGNTFMNLKEGIICVDKIKFTHNSSWKGNRQCRLGARSMNPDLPTLVKEAKTELFLVRDRRSRLYNNNPNPSLSDPVYRLYKISRRGECLKRLRKANINTVRDLLTVHAINPERLKEILDVRPEIWKIIMDHAQMCKDDNGRYLYHHPRNGQKSTGVVFNIAGQLVGILAESQFVPCEMLPNDKRADAQKLIVSSYEHWKEVVSFNDQAALIKHIQIQSNTTLNSFPNNLNIVIPHTNDPHDHTNLSSPPTITPSSDSINNQLYVTAGVVLQSPSESPKRPASELTISNSPKKPREDQFSMSSPTNSVVTSRMTNTNPENLMQHSEDVNEDEEYLQYLNLSELDKWKMVSIAVGWISMISKVRKRRMTFRHDNTVILISASMT